MCATYTDSSNHVILQQNQSMLVVFHPHRLLQMNRLWNKQTKIQMNKNSKSNIELNSTHRPFPCPNSQELTILWTKRWTTQLVRNCAFLWYSFWLLIQKLLLASNTTTSEFFEWLAENEERKKVCFLFLQEFIFRIW